MQVYAGCMCQHDTEGVHCDQCATGFNNVPWAPGTDTEANACQGMFMRGSDRMIVLPWANKTCRLPCSESACHCIGGWLETLLHKEKKPSRMTHAEMAQWLCGKCACAEDCESWLLPFSCTLVVRTLAARSWVLSPSDCQFFTCPLFVSYTIKCVLRTQLPCTMSCN